MPLGGGSRIVDAGKVDGWGEVEEVELLTLDDVIGEDRDVSAIHLDIENREQQALAGGMCTIERCRPQLVLETLPREGWIAENLGRLGYGVMGAVDGNFVMASRPVGGRGGGRLY